MVAEVAVCGPKIIEAGLRWRRRKNTADCPEPRPRQARVGKRRRIVRFAIDIKGKNAAVIAQPLEARFADPKARPELAR